MFAQIMAPAMRRDVLLAAADRSPQLLVHEEGEYAGPVAATELGIPWVTHAWGCPLRSHDDLVQLECDAEPLWQQAGLDVPPAAGLYAHGVVDPCPPFLQATRPGVARAWALRPETLQLSGRLPSTEALPEGLLAYVRFGTVPLFAGAPDELSAAVEACIANGLGAVVTTSNDAVRQKLVAAHADRVAVSSFVSFPDLLPRCRVVVCHAGAGTVLAALAAGVPLVLVPRGAPSQMRMAEACEAARVAITVPPSDLVRLSAAVSMAIDEARVGRASLAAEQIHAMPSADELVPALETIANS